MLTLICNKKGTVHSCRKQKKLKKTVQSLHLYSLILCGFAKECKTRESECNNQQFLPFLVQFRISGIALEN